MRKSVDGLGLAAYLKLHGFAVAARTTARSYTFDVPEERESEFDECRRNWINTTYAKFDSEAVMLRRMDITPGGTE